MKTDSQVVKRVNWCEWQKNWEEVVAMREETVSRFAGKLNAPAS